MVVGHVTLEVERPLQYVVKTFCGIIAVPTVPIVDAFVKAQTKPEPMLLLLGVLLLLGAVARICTVHVAVVPGHVLASAALLTVMLKFPTDVGVRFACHVRVEVATGAVPQYTVKIFAGTIGVFTTPVVPEFVKLQISGVVFTVPLLLLLLLLLD